jgi:prophage maintenance system killer protein
MADHSHTFFDVESIRSNFLDVQCQFHAINRKIRCQRDFFGNDVIENLLSAYRYINLCLTENPRKHLIDTYALLELNAIVLIGMDQAKRAEYDVFVSATKRKFSHYIDPLMKWYLRHEHDNDDPYKIAAGLYVRILAAPQLFIEGNHRTGAMVANYYLLMAGEMPFILTVENAVEFFNLASDVKFKKTDIGSKFRRATGWHDEVARMRVFLKSNARPFTHRHNHARTELKHGSAKKSGDSLNHG